MSLEKIAKTLTIGGGVLVLASVAFTAYERIEHKNRPIYEIAASLVALVSTASMFTGAWLSNYNRMQTTQQK